MKTRTSQRLPVLPILFLIYISKVFLEIEFYLLQIIYLLFIDDLSFLVASKCVMKIKKILKKVGKITVD